MPKKWRRCGWLSPAGDVDRMAGIAKDLNELLKTVGKVDGACYWPEAYLLA